MTTITVSLIEQFIQQHTNQLKQMEQNIGIIPDEDYHYECKIDLNDRENLNDIDSQIDLNLKTKENLEHFVSEIEKYQKEMNQKIDEMKKEKERQLDNTKQAINQLIDEGKRIINRNGNQQERANKINSIERYRQRTKQMNLEEENARLREENERLRLERTNNQIKLNKIEMEIKDMKIFIEDTNIPTFIERLCGRKTGIVLFDSRIHRWNQNDSEFYSKLNGRSNVCIVIFGKFGNIFGGYVAGLINGTSWNINSNTFLFSLNRGGGSVIIPRKYPSKCGNRYGFKIENNSYHVLFSFGPEPERGTNWVKDLYIWKKDYSTWGYCDQHSFDHNGETNALCGSTIFEIEKFLVFQMN